MQKEKEPEQPTNKTLNLALLLCRIAVGCIFLASGFLKTIKPPESLAAAIESYELIPAVITLPLAKILPWVELLLGGYLFTGYLTRFSAIGISGLLFMFLAALGSAKLRNIPIGECGCFGGMGPHLSTGQAIIFDCALLAACLSIFFTRPRWLSLDSWINKGK